VVPVGGRSSRRHRRIRRPQLPATGGGWPRPRPRPCERSEPWRRDPSTASSNHPSNPRSPGGPRESPTGRDLHSPIDRVTDRYPAGRSDKRLYDVLSLRPPRSTVPSSILRDAGGNDRAERRTAHPPRETGANEAPPAPDPPWRPDVRVGGLRYPVVDLQPIGAVLATSAARAIHPASGAPHGVTAWNDRPPKAVWRSSPAARDRGGRSGGPGSRAGEAGAHGW
jgi:hypothetical protein